MPSGGDLIRLETVGRRTGEPHDVLVRFITVDRRIVVFPQNRGRQDWVANVAENGAVRVFAAGGVISGSASIHPIRGLRDPLLAVFTRKYGEAEARKRYWGQTVYVEIEVAAQSTPVDYRELHYADLEAAFDGVAEDYDGHILGNEMNVWLRDRSVGLMSRVFSPGEVVLEVGCGTGTETLQLAERGVRVIASDISGKMLEVLARKAAKLGLDSMVTPLHARPYELGEKLRELGFPRIDGAYSTYGAINTEPGLGPMTRELHSAMRPGGKLIVGVWNKYCLYEMVGYALRMRPRMTVARLRNPVAVGLSRFCVSSTAYSVGSLSAALSGSFRLERVYGVEILLPPSNLTRYLPRGRLLALLKRMEVAIEGSYPWNRLGDHFLGVYSRVG